MKSGKRGYFVMSTKKTPSLPGIDITSVKVTHYLGLRLRAALRINEVYRERSRELRTP